MSGILEGHFFICFMIMGVLKFYVKDQVLNETKQKKL